jgi:hypothetical protein
MAPGPLPSLDSPVRDLSDRLVPGSVRPYLAPGLMALLFVLGLSLSATRLGLLLDWPDRYDGTGRHLVLGCEAAGAGGGDAWVCDGALVVDGSSTDVRSDLVTSRGAVASHQPYVGERTEVFFDGGDLGTVHPTSYRLNELARLYLSLLPRLLLVGGAAIWLAGWYLTRNLDVADLVVRDRVRFPGRFVWKTRGAQWLTVAVLWGIGNHVLTGRVLGSLGTF